MITKLLFISEKKSMIANALLQGLTDAFFEVQEVGISIKDISRVQDVPVIWLLYLQGFDGHMTNVLTYMKDVIDEHKVRLFTVDTDEELEKALKLLC